MKGAAVHVATYAVGGDLSLRALLYAFGKQYTTDELVFAIHDLLVEGVLERCAPGRYRLVRQQAQG